MKRPESYEERKLVAFLQDQHKDNCIIQIAVKFKRDYVVPEDIDKVPTTIDIATFRLHALQLLGNNTGYGVEDATLFAQVAAERV